MALGLAWTCRLYITWQPCPVSALLGQTSNLLGVTMEFDARLYNAGRRNRKALLFVRNADATSTISI